MPGGKRNKRKRRRAAAAERRKKDEEESTPSSRHKPVKKRQRKETTNISVEAVATARKPQQVKSGRKGIHSNNQMANNNREERCIIFQDVMKDVLLVTDDDDDCTNNTKNGAHADAKDYEEQVSLAFFELANSPYVGYRIKNEKDKEEEEAHNNGSKKPRYSNNNRNSNETIMKMKSDCVNSCVVLKQDTENACGKHTGGIVWETAYLLLQYILSTQTNLGNCLEVGAGCGLIGQVLAVQTDIVSSTKIVMTEHPDVLPNLQYNVEQNQHHFHPCRKKRQKKGKENARSTSSSSSTPLLSVCNLDWEHYQQDAQTNPQHLGSQPHSFDTILGTDVVFTPKLVEPLLETIQYMSHSETNIYLCLQERCTTSHKLLMDKAPQYNFRLADITHQIDTIPLCRKWGTALECRLFHITQITTNNKSSTVS